MSREFIGKDLSVFLEEEEISSIEYDLKEFKITMEENRHSILYIEVEIKKEFQEKYTINKFLKLEQKEIFGNSKYNNKKIEIKFNNLEYFCGIIKSIKIGNENSKGISVVIEAKSKSEMLDRVKKYRVYQNINATYEEIIKELLNPYQEEIKYLINEKIKISKINKVFIQYNETEWEFLIRIMSNIGLAVFNGGYGEIILGHINNEGKKINFKAQKDTLHLLDEKGNSFIGISATEAHLLGENLFNKQEDYGFISSGKLEYFKGKFRGDYLLRKADYYYNYISNRNIEGKAIEAKIVKVPKESKSDIAKLSLNFSEGVMKLRAAQQKINRDVQSKNDYLGEKENRYEFPYITPYTRINTGLFCAPEIEDNVTVYFPTDEEDCGYVIGSINNKKSIRFSNPYERNYTLSDQENKKIFDLKIKSDNYTLYAYDFIDMGGKNEVKITSENQIFLDSKNQININSDKKLSVIGDEVISTFRNSLESVSELKDERIETLEGNYIKSYSISAQNTKIRVAENYFLNAGKIKMKS